MITLDDFKKIEVKIGFLQKDQDRREIALLKLEKENREDHDKILNKLDNLRDNGK